MVAKVVFPGETMVVYVRAEQSCTIFNQTVVDPDSFSIRIVIAMGNFQAGSA